VVVVETVGVGQSEVKIDDAVDVVCLVLPPASGDELQGCKKGITEVADLVVVNKADGELLRDANRTASSYRSALEMSRPKFVGWTTPVLKASARAGTGVAETWESVQKCRSVLEASGEFLGRRKRQAEFWMWEELRAQIMRLVEHDPHLRALAASEARALASGPLVGNINRSIRSSEDVSAGAQPSRGGGGAVAPSATTPRAAASRLMAAVAERLSGQGGGREGGTGGTSGMGRYSGTSNGGALEK